jgi:hypothetical protein
MWGRAPLRSIGVSIAATNVQRRQANAYGRAGSTWTMRRFVALRSGAGEQALSDVRSALGDGGFAFPMFVAGRLQGALVCGERAQQYTPDERQSLKTVAHEVGAALQSLKARESERVLEELARGKLSVRDVREHVLRASR